MKTKQAGDPYYNFYRHTFRNDPIFNIQSSNGSHADMYAHKVISDALDIGENVELAYEAMVIFTMWMEIVHLLNSAVTKCKDPSLSGSAETDIDDALAFYVGVSQTKGQTDGYLLYALAQKSANVFGTKDEVSGEANANTKVISLFKELKDVIELVLADRH